MRVNTVCLLLSLVLLSSCGKSSAPGALLHADPVVVENVIDFTKYSEAGFLMTPEGYDGDYEPRGLLDATLLPEVQEKEPGSANPSTSPSSRAYGRDWGPGVPKQAAPVEKERWLDVREVTAAQAMDLIYDRAVALGADALIHLKIETVDKNIGPYSYTGLKISGLAIRRAGSAN